MSVRIPDIPEAVKAQLEELVERIREGKVAIFCGSGISIRPPSNLPSAISLREAILECLIDVSILDDKVRKRLVEGVVAERENGGSLNEGRGLHYPFEAFIQRLEENASIIETLAKMFRKGEPNRNHFFFSFSLLLEPGVFKLENPFNGFDGVLIRYNTDAIVDYLWDSLIGKPWHGPEDWSEEWKKPIRDWGIELQEDQILCDGTDSI